MLKSLNPSKIRPIHDSNGEIIGAVENIQDITEIDEMEKKAVKARQMTRGV